MSQNKVYQIITNKIVESLKNGVIPWRKPWFLHGMPKNFITKKPYRGINYLLLSLYDEEYFLTFNQAKRLGGYVKKGAIGIPVIYWNFTEVKKEVDEHKEEPEFVPLVRYYTVFKASDTEGIEIPASEQRIISSFDTIEAAEVIENNMQNAPKVMHGYHKAVYAKSSDMIKLPDVEMFESAAAYHATRFHEMVHSTGAEHRLKRRELVEYHGFGSYDYSREELTAEIGAAFLCAQAGISPETLENSEAYIKSWLRKFNDDPKMIILAAGKAQKAVDYILGISEGQNAESGEGERIAS